ncbi:LRR repeats and ubiquitin-like domain-containing protein At2g30105 isoform X2 [Tripterygium wilfordii]|uniref:LRR repeats and ubiquitin-like domain-containing protein At2g30105 isoform X2 n=1 Tax=Tripterygium wilfordii TaxID=458696 RepID=UPI0018F7FF1B|nr:LRR repeats and ubiquitin-like domain-containing protein At2g30105 isoform X2 [Tripterygium wilfordii]
METGKTDAAAGELKPQSCSSMVTIKVKFGGRSIPISVMPDSTIKDLKSLLQPLTNVLPRGQKLIFKGRVLVDAMTVRESGVTNGANVMLIATQGLHQGDGPILNKAQIRPVRTGNVDELLKMKEDVKVEKNHVERWKITGVIALADRNLKAIPDDVWTCGSLARVLEISNNSVQDVPTKIGSLESLQKLFLNANAISDESIDWEGLKSLKYLTVLSVSQNNLTTLPSSLGALTCLRQLHIAHNKLTSLPTEIGFLSQLEVLKANNNRLSNIPSCIGKCSSLIEVDLSSNLLSAIPDAVGNLRNLKALHLGNNGLKHLPPTLFKMCLQLSTLDLHNTEITVDTLRQGGKLLMIAAA